MQIGEATILGMTVCRFRSLMSTTRQATRCHWTARHSQCNRMITRDILAGFPYFDLRMTDTWTVYAQGYHLGTIVMNPDGKRLRADCAQPATEEPSGSKSKAVGSSSLVDDLCRCQCRILQNSGALKQSSNYGCSLAQCYHRLSIWNCPEGSLQRRSNAAPLRNDIASYEPSFSKHLTRCTYTLSTTAVRGERTVVRRCVDLRINKQIHTYHIQ